MAEIKKQYGIRRLELNRETIHSLTEEEAEAVAGGNILEQSRRLACGTNACRPSRTCPTLKYDCRVA